MEARLLISHPNYNGMHRAAASNDYTPARYLTKVAVTVGNAKAFDLETGISMSEDPSIAFTYQAKAGGGIDVRAQDKHVGGVLAALRSAGLRRPSAPRLPSRQL